MATRRGSAMGQLAPLDVHSANGSYGPSGAVRPPPAYASLGRVGMWRGGCRPGISVAAPFVWRCLTGSTVAPFPHPAHRTGRADLPHPALGQDSTPLLSRATPSAVSETLFGVDRLPNLQVPHRVLRLS